MRRILPQNLLFLAENCDEPLYVVGGSVRDFLCNKAPLSQKRDFDLSSPMPVDEFLKRANACNFTANAVYRNTGTVKLSDSTGAEYEYSRFRSDKYVRGVHVPVETTFTNDISLDAKRRDFTANAVYYDVKANAFVDPLDGISAIKEKRLTTVAPAQKVFSEDGLRLMRLCRQAATLGFYPDEECLLGAKANAALIRDITPERVYAELHAILHAEEKYGVDGVYQGLKLLDDTRVLDYILPELAAGRNVKQRADFHNYDVLGHSLRACAYAASEVRLAALLHDVGKPTCEKRDGNVHDHPEVGAKLAREILTRLKAPKKLTEETVALVSLHMYDFNCQTGENKLRRFFAEHAPLLDKLLLVKQADFSACKDDTSVAPTCRKWRALLEKMRLENAPLTVKELRVSGKDLADCGVPLANIATTLKKLLLHVVCNPKDNVKEKLVRLALKL